MIIRDNWTPEEIEHADEICQFRDAFRNGGITSEGTKLTIQDALSTPNAPIMFKRVITEVMREAIEPNLIGTSLLQRIDFDGYGVSISFGTLGATAGLALDMAEGQEYPEFSVQHGSGSVTANIGKVGAAFKVTEETLRYSMWDVIGMHTRQVAKALARHKERKIFDMFHRLGVTIFDNRNPANSELGRTTGRDLTGSGNGSMTYDDFFDMYSKTLERGFTPNVVLCHPLAWAAFVKDPVMRAFTLQNGGGKWYNGSPQNVYPTSANAWNAIGKAKGPTEKNPTKEEREGTQTSAFEFPINFPFGGLRIIPSHHVQFDPQTNTTSIYMMDTTELGAIIVNEDPTSEEWTDPARDITKIKVRERYGMVLFNEGLAISVAKNVSIEPNEIVLPPQTIISGVTPIARK